MNKTIFSVLAAVAIALSATGSTAAPVGPVVNGDFELAVPLKGVTCEVFGDLTVNVLPPDQDPELTVEDPTGEVGDQGVPWYWLVTATPCESGAMKALQWSSSRVSQWGDYDGDDDREVRIDGSITLPEGDSIGKGHNFWQAYPNPHQAWSANFGSLTFRVEDGTIPRSASVILSLSNSPVDVPSPYLGIFLTCQLAFGGLQADQDGLVSLDPVTDGVFTSRDPQCDLLKAAWDAGDAETKREVLGRTRIVQHSFWNFNSNDATITLDDVSINDSRLFVEDLVDQSL